MFKYRKIVYSENKQKMDSLKFKQGGLCYADLSVNLGKSYEPRCEKTGLRGFRPGLTQTGLCSQRRWLEA